MNNYLKLVNEYIERIKGSPEHVRKTVFVITVTLVTVLVFAGWLVTMRFFNPGLAGENKKQFKESQTKEFGSDIHSIFNALQERLKNDDNTNIKTPPTYFLDTRSLPNLNQESGK